MQLKLTAIAALCCATLATSTHAATVYSENFDNPVLNGKGATGPNNTVDMADVTGWSINVSQANLSATSDWFRVQNAAFEGRDLDGPAVWTTDSINISGMSNVSFSLNAAESGNHENTDYFDVAYSVDGGNFITISNWNSKGTNEHTLVDDFTSETITQAIPAGSSTLQIRVTMLNNAGSERLRLDNVTVTGDGVNVDTPPQIASTMPTDGATNVALDAAIVVTFNEPVTVASWNDISCGNSGMIAVSASSDGSTFTLTPANNFAQNEVCTVTVPGATVTDQDGTPDNMASDFSFSFTTQAPTPASAVVITEIMQNPSKVSDGKGEWFEVFNNGTEAVNLSGWTVRDNGSDSFVISGNLVIQPGAYAVIANNDDFASNGGIRVDYTYTGMFLGNGNDELILINNNGNEVDRVEWDNGATFPDPNGASMTLIDVNSDNNVGSNWQAATVQYGKGDFGTPNSKSGTFNLVVSEIMQNPTKVRDNKGEWFELYNADSFAINLNGWTIRDNDNDAFVVDQDVIIPAGGFVVLANNGDTATNGGVNVDFAYNGMFLGNGIDEIVLLTPASEEMDRVEWDNGATFPDPSGASMELQGLLLDNNTGTNWAAATKPYGNGDLGTPGTGPGDDGGEPGELVKVHQIQGADAASPLVGNNVTIQGIVVGDFQSGAGSNGSLNGFYVQEEDTDADANSATSEGIFVFDGPTPTVNVNTGDKVTVSGTVAEFFGETQLSSITSVTVDSQENTLPTAASVTLPAQATIDNGRGRLIPDLEAFEGMLVTFPSTLTVTELSQLDRYGEMQLAQGGRLYQFTQQNAPDAAGYQAHVQNIASRRIFLDDGFNTQNPTPIRFPAPGFSADNALRMGDTVTNLTGVLRFSRSSGSRGTSAYRVMPTIEPNFVLNPRQDRPNVGGNLSVASLNVLNFFNTLDTNESAGCFPRFTRRDCRGADSQAEYNRQLAKLVTALVKLDADIIGLVEIENDYTDGANSSIAQLVAAVNADARNRRCSNYSFIDPGMRVGTDAIAVGLMYCADTVRQKDDTSIAILDDSNLPPGVSAPLFNGRGTNRAMLTASFTQRSNNESLTVAVNHFKSKGSGCGAGNDDTSTGQGNCNLTRTNAAKAAHLWLATDPTGSGDPDFLIIGDLNAYAKEDPLTELKNNGYTNVINDIEAYSYVFDGQAGSLDHGLVTASLLEQMTGAADWHINADEADALDYNLDSGTNNRLAIFDGSQPHRAADHDPLIIGFELRSGSEPVPGDINGDGNVDQSDYSAFIAAYGSSQGGQTYVAAADMNSDGVINMVDFQLWYQAYLAAQQG